MSQEEENPEQKDEENPEWELEFEEEIIQRKRKRRRKKNVAAETEEEAEIEDEFHSESEEESTTSEESSESSACEEFGPVTFEFEDETYEFEPIAKPKKLKDILILKSAKEEEDELGQKRYLSVSRALEIPPVQRFYKSLNKEEIDLSYCGINPRGIRGICEALELNKKVRSLNLQDNQLTKDACYHLGILLHLNGVLSHLDLTGCRIGPEGIGTIADALSDNETLKTLNLSKCYIGDEGMKTLAKGIKYNNGLQVLNLSHNRLENEGAEALGLAFRINTNIRELDLNYNEMFGGMRAFFKGLMENEGITKLILSWNALGGEETGRFVSAFLKKSKWIRYLDLSSNRFDKAAVNEIRSGLQNAQTLEVLKLGKNPIPPDSLDGLLGAVSGLENLRILDLEDLWAKKSFNQALSKIKETKNIQVNFAGVFSNYQIIGPDYKKLLLERARFEALKPKNKKARKDLGHLLWILGDDPMSKDDFMETVKNFKAKISPAIFPELMKEYLISKTSIDVKAIRDKYLSLYPDSRPAPLKMKKDDVAEGGEDEEGAEIPVDVLSHKETLLAKFEVIETGFSPDENENEFESEEALELSSYQEETISTEETSELQEQLEEELY